MLRLFYVILLGLVGAGMVHIAILFMLPSYSERDIWSRLSAVAAPYAVVNLGPEALRDNAPAPRNPFLLPAACRFDLADGPVHVQSPQTVPFWSVSIYNEDGLNIFSISDRTATDRVLDFVILTTAQMQVIRSGIPSELGRSVFIETDAEEGIALVRVFAPDETWQGVAAAFVAELSCRPVALD